MKVRSPALKRFAKRWARRTFATVERVCAFRGASHPLPGMRILTYHRVIKDSVDPFAVDPVSFTHQLETLADLGIVRPLNMALVTLGQPNPVRMEVVLTFDDGTVDFVEHVWPVLEKLRLPATLYVNPARVGTEGFLGWSDLIALSRQAVNVESHGLEHRSLGSLTRTEMRRELTESRQVLEDKLGSTVSSFAYPYGTLRDFNPVSREEVRRAGYRSACTSLNGLNVEGTDPLELHRTKIEGGDGPIFSWILGGCLDRWEWIDRRFSKFQNRYAIVP